MTMAGTTWTPTPLAQLPTNEFLFGLLADNATGEISAQDLRDVLDAVLSRVLTGNPFDPNTSYVAGQTALVSTGTPPNQTYALYIAKGPIPPSTVPPGQPGASNLWASLTGGSGTVQVGAPSVRPGANTVKPGDLYLSVNPAVVPAGMLPVWPTLAVSDGTNWHDVGDVEIGTIAARPINGRQAGQRYFATDVGAGQLQIWNGRAWVPASTTDSTFGGMIVSNVVTSGQFTLTTLPPMSPTNPGKFYIASEHFVIPPGFPTATLVGENISPGDWLVDTGTSWAHVPVSPSLATYTSTDAAGVTPTNYQPPLSPIAGDIFINSKDNSSWIFGPDPANPGKHIWLQISGDTPPPAPLHNAGATYEEGDLVWYDDLLYRANAPIGAGGGKVLGDWIVSAQYDGHPAIHQGEIVFNKTAGGPGTTDTVSINGYNAPGADHIADIGNLNPGDLLVVGGIQFEITGKTVAAGYTTYQVTTKAGSVPNPAMQFTAPVTVVPATGATPDVSKLWDLVSSPGMSPFDPTKDYRAGDIALVQGTPPDTSYTVWRAEKDIPASVEIPGTANASTDWVMVSSGLDVEVGMGPPPATLPPHRFYIDRSANPATAAMAALPLPNPDTVLATDPHNVIRWLPFPKELPDPYVINRILGVDTAGHLQWVEAVQTAVMAGVITVTSDVPSLHQFSWTAMAANAGLWDTFKNGNYLVVEGPPAGTTGNTGVVPAGMGSASGKPVKAGDWLVAIDTNNDGKADDWHVVEQQVPDPLPSMAGHKAGEVLVSVDPTTNKATWAPMRMIADWAATSSYQTGEIVISDHSFWRALQPNNTQPDDKNPAWERIDLIKGTPDQTGIGRIDMFSVLPLPATHLLCDGSTFDKNAYPDLFKFLGSDKLPDLRNQFVRGWSATRAPMSSEDFATALPKAGFSTSSAGSHRHTFDDHTASSDDNGAGKIASGGSNWDNQGLNGTHMNDAGAHTHSVSGGDAETRPANVAVVYGIQALPVTTLTAVKPAPPVKGWIDGDWPVDSVVVHGGRLWRAVSAVPQGSGPPAAPLWEAVSEKTIVPDWHDADWPKDAVVITPDGKTWRAASNISTGSPAPAAPAWIMVATPESMAKTPDWDTTKLWPKDSLVVSTDGKLWRARVDIPANAPVPAAPNWEPLGGTVAPVAQVQNAAVAANATWAFTPNWTLYKRIRIEFELSLTGLCLTPTGRGLAFTGMQLASDGAVSPYKVTMADGADGTLVVSGNGGVISGYLDIGVPQGGTQRRFEFDTWFTGDKMVSVSGLQNADTTLTALTFKALAAGAWDIRAYAVG